MNNYFILEGTIIVESEAITATIDGTLTLGNPDIATLTVGL